LPEKWRAGSSPAGGTTGFQILIAKMLGDLRNVCVQGIQMLRALISAVFCLGVSGQVEACEVALVLAVDVSGSVDPGEYDIQMGGLATALRDPSVSEALVASQAHVMLIQWTGSDRQAVSVDWTEMARFDDVFALANQIETAPRLWRNFSTAIGEAIELALVAFDDPRVDHCQRKVIDVSGDGPSNEGVSPTVPRAQAAARNVTINALAIESREAGLADYFRDNVIVGDGAFAMRAATFADYPDRIRVKLIREITKQVARLHMPAEIQAGPLLAQKE